MLEEILFCKRLGFNAALDFNEADFIHRNDVLSTINTVEKVLKIFSMGYDDLIYYYPNFKTYLFSDNSTYYPTYFNVYGFFRDAWQYPDAFKKDLRKMVMSYRRENDWN